MEWMGIGKLQKLEHGDMLLVTIKRRSVHVPALHCHAEYKDTAAAYVQDLYLRAYGEKHKTALHSRRMMVPGLPLAFMDTVR